MAEGGIRNPRQTQRDVWRARCGDNPHAGFGSAARGNPPAGTPAGRPGPTSPRAGLAGAARPLRRRQGRRDPDASARGRGTASHEHPAETDLARPRRAQRTEQTLGCPPRCTGRGWCRPERYCAGTTTSSPAGGPTRTDDQADHPPHRRSGTSCCRWPARIPAGATDGSRASWSDSAIPWPPRLSGGS